MLGHKLANNFDDAGRHRNGFDQIVSGATKILRLQQGCLDCKKLVAGPDIAGRKATHKCGTGAARFDSRSLSPSDAVPLAAAPRIEDATRLFSTPKALTDWRALCGYSQRQAIDAVGCSRGAWAGWEKGDKPVLKYISLAVAALSLGIGR